MERFVTQGFVMQEQVAEHKRLSRLIIAGILVGVIITTGCVLYCSLHYYFNNFQSNQEDQLVLRSIDTRHNLMSETEKYYGNQPGVTREYLLNITIERYSNHDGRLDEIKTYLGDTVIRHKTYTYDEQNLLFAKTEKYYNHEGKFLRKTKVYYNDTGKPIQKSIWGKKEE